MCLKGILPPDLPPSARARIVGVTCLFLCLVWGALVVYVLGGSLLPDL